ncbi:MAG: hypothetical protein LBU69_04910 [Deltaproteobacteria bacterium]|jgi:nickel transport protein|nr:hypothetical protein [Deltaproteobacteria bacterium]
MKVPDRILIKALAIAACFIAFAAKAEAHGVFIFAWPQGDLICSNSYFSGNSPVRHGTVKIQDPEGNTLDTALTDEKGGVCFNRPQTTSELAFVVEAGEGHRATFKLSASDLPPSGASSPGAEPGALATEKTGALAAESAGESSPASLPEPTGAAPANAGQAIGAAELRIMLREELGNQLGPINRALAETGDNSPSLKDIIGGLGWLAGIFGLAFWLAGRKQRQKS